jgi:hypothetical protein
VVFLSAFNPHTVAEPHRLLTGLPFYALFEHPEKNYQLDKYHTTKNTVNMSFGTPALSHSPRVTTFEKACDSSGNKVTDPSAHSVPWILRFLRLLEKVPGPRH